MSKNRKKDKKKVRAEPKSTAQAWLVSDEAYQTLCCTNYTRLSDNPEIQAAVNKICDLISSMTIHQMQNTPNGDTRIKDGISRMVDITPNPYMTRKTFMSVVVRTLLLEGDGNAVVVPETRSGYLYSLNPIPPGYVSFLPQAAGYGYQVMINGNIYDPDTLLHFVINPSPDYPW